MPIDSFKHKNEKRPLIPSVEEEGFEKANPNVREGEIKEYPINPVISRGQDPELFWLDKYGIDNQLEYLGVDIRSLYRSEHISPEILIQKLYELKEVDENQLSLTELFGNTLEMDELEKVSEYYKHQEGWTNRLILGDSLLVMNSLLEREGLARKVQMIYIDPPYGIKYGSNWQMKLNNRDVKDGKDEHLTGEPEQIKAYRDTWELGIHSYLSYLRDRLLIVKELLTESGSVFIQISDENVHLVRNIVDEVFGSDNYMSLISYRVKSPLGVKYLGRNNDFIIWYCKNKSSVKYRQLYLPKKPENQPEFNLIKLKNGKVYSIAEYLQIENKIPQEAIYLTAQNLASSGYTESCMYDIEINQKVYLPPRGKSWKTNRSGMERLKELGRLIPLKNSLRYAYYLDDFPVTEINNVWIDTFAESSSQYVVQTNSTVIERCVLMTSDPGDLILDPTCGAGTSAFVAEKWGRRWITIDTSRVALNIAKNRLTTSIFPYYLLYDEQNKDIRQGFIYKKVPHITLKALANDEPPDEETLFDQPFEDKKRLRVTGPFIVETLQSLNPLSPEDLNKYKGEDDNFEERVFEHLKSAGVKTGIKEEKAVFTRIDRLGSLYIHAEGFYNAKEGEKKTYIHIGPKYGTVSKLTVNEAVKECRTRGDVNWLIILGFSFESEIQNQEVTTSVGTFQVTKVRMHDDLMQDGLLKKDKKAGSFMTIGEPDIKQHKTKDTVTLEILGLDIYDPITDVVKPRDIQDIAYWMVDDDYDGSNFIVKQMFFCGGEKNEFDKWKKGLENLAITSARKKVEKTLKIEIEQEAFERLYGHKSHPIEIKKKNQKVAVKVISQFGEESMKVFEIK